MKPKVVIYSAFLTPFRSGAEACAEEVPLRLKHDFDFTIITSRLRRNLPKKDMLQGHIPVIRVGFGSKFDKWLFPFLAPLAARKLKPDIIHAILETFAGQALMHSSVIVFKAKRILTLQTTNRSFKKKEITKSPHKVTAISSALVNYAKSVGRNDAVLIPNGVNSEEIESALGWYEKIKGRILFVGRLEPQKGVDILLQALAKFKQENWDLNIVGDGSQKEILTKLSQDLGITERVHFKGYVAPPDVYKEYAQAEIFCGLSRSEALGNVFLEAQAAGCAVIGTKTGGIPDIVQNGTNGILIKPDNIDMAVEAIGRLLKDPSQRSKLSSAGKKNAQKYDWGRIAKEYAQVYMEAIKD
ncbi:MAG: glycosyltransferase family 4 protein [Candidatus Peribacteraceae bacterium]|jgi:glycosyltransferase involved in cell wall biosynthesis|nr:glycosyltransferase family 4 protein [Candidatus Peribacteraceae bacterium]MDP7454703.1 glycosyltransferase family 4 protein [Candidatus Peribacteraceae bacterium]MDP7646362.1 glycosyltransferase family 4 protein [Candidatus Peribacteraceae bacterium]|tara:strand:- start:2843 stop:3910 length:1068 start_codon:yes stop_codon:yes gene_type:complete